MVDFVVGLLFLLVGLISAALVGRDIVRGQRSRRWPRTTAVILRADISLTRSIYGDQYRTAISYRYEIDEQAYTGERAFFGDDTKWGSRRFAARFVSRFTVGATAQISYDPDKPQDSVLEPGVRPRLFWLFGLGLLFAFLGSVSFIRGL